MNIRLETLTDSEKIKIVHRAAFETDTEANLVDALKDSGIEVIPLVAEEGDEVIGHILFSPVTLDGVGEIRIMGLEPMAVMPNWQRKGIGT